MSGRHPKTILLGDMNVGKTALIHSFINNEFQSKLANTTGACFQRCDIQLDDGRNVSMDIWDTAGQEKYRSLLSLYYKNCDAIIMVFDVTRQQTFETVGFWAQQISDTCETQPGIVLIGNKYDLKDKVKIISEDKARQYASSKGWTYMCASAMTGLNVKQIFKKAASLALQAKEKSEKKEKSKSPTKINKNKKKQSCC